MSPALLPLLIQRLDERQVRSPQSPPLLNLRQPLNILGQKQLA